MLDWILDYPALFGVAVMLVVFIGLVLLLRPKHDWLENPERYRKAAAQGLLIASSERTYSGELAREQIFIVYLEHRLQLLREGVLKDHPETTEITAERLLNHWIARVPESELVALLVERAHAMEDLAGRGQATQRTRYMHLVR